MALAVSAGVCSAGRIGTVATGFGLTPGMAAVPDICALAGAPAATNINVAVSIDLMTNPGGHCGVIDVQAIKHICLVGNNCTMVQETGGWMAKPSLRGAKQ
jgi:hypothetical protein